MRKGKIRDSQRSKLYKADRCLYRFSSPLPEVSDIERYVVKVWASQSLAKAYPAAFGLGLDKDGNRWKNAPVVKPGKARRRAGGCEHYITMPKWSRRTDVTLHELAHVVTRRVYGDGVAGHGPEYCRVFLRLVRTMMGAEAETALRESFRTCRVKYKNKKSRKPMTEERKAQLRENLVKARAARKLKPKSIYQLFPKERN